MNQRVPVWMGALMLAAVAAVQAQAPRIHCENPVWDFGTISDKQPVAYRFALENRGDLTLTVEKVVSTCGCTVSVMKEPVIPPGGRSALEVTFSPEGRRGRQHKSLKVHSTDPLTPVLELQIQGTVSPDFWISPGHLWLALKTGDSIDRNITLDFKKPVRIKEVTTDISLLRLQLVCFKEDRIFTVRVTAPAPLPVGRIKGAVYIDTDLYGRLTVPVRGVVN